MRNMWSERRIAWERRGRDIFFILAPEEERDVSIIWKFDGEVKLFRLGMWSSHYGLYEYWKGVTKREKKKDYKRLYRKEDKG